MSFVANASKAYWVEVLAKISSAQFVGAISVLRYWMWTSFQLLNRTLVLRTSVHSDKPHTLYCESCKKPVCEDCQDSLCLRDRHSLLPLMEEKEANVKEEAIQGSIESCYKQMTVQLKASSEASRNIEECREKYLSRLEQTFDALSEVLQKQKHRLGDAIEEHYKELESYNNLRIQKLAEKVEESQTLVETSELPSLQNSVTLLEKDNLKHQGALKVVEKKFSDPIPHLTEALDLTLTVVTPGELELLCKRNSVSKTLEGFLEAAADCQSMVSGEPFQSRFYCSSGKEKLEASLLCCFDNTSQPVAMSQQSPNVFELTVVPQERGKHELLIQHKGLHIGNSPFSSYVQLHPRQITTHKVYSSLHNPGGIHSSGGQIFVAEMGKGIAVLEHSSEGIKCVNRLKLEGHVGELTSHNDFIFCTDQKNHQLIRMNKNGSEVKRSGYKGTEEGSFNYPNGIAVSLSNEIFVCDTDNHRLQIFDVQLNFRRSIGGRNNTSVRFSSPSGVKFDSEGKFYVVDTGKNQIQVFTEKEEFSHVIGKSGKGIGELNHPISIAIHGHYLYITDCYNDRIAVFTHDGKGESSTQLRGKCATCKRPACVAVDSNGYIYVTTDRSELVVL